MQKFCSSGVAAHLVGRLGQKEIPDAAKRCKLGGTMSESVGKESDGSGGGGGYLRPHPCCKLCKCLESATVAPGAEK